MIPAHMKIVVCIKQVPEQGSVKIDPETHRMDRANAYSVMNPYCESALETALRLKDRYSAEITVITMGLPRAESILRKALSCGADHAILVSDPAFGGSDTLATAYTLSLALKKLNFDLLLFGRQSIDGDTGQVGPESARLLDLPILTSVRSIVPCENGFRVQRLSEHWNIESPCALTVIKEDNELRAPQFQLRMAAKHADIPILGKAELHPDPGKTGLAGSPTRVTEIQVPTYGNERKMLTGSVPEMVSGLIDCLEKRGALE